MQYIIYYLRKQKPRPSHLGPGLEAARLPAKACELPLDPAPAWRG